MFDTTKIDYKFIVVYDKLTEPIAQSISNRAIAKDIKSTTWSKKEYLGNKPSLTNNNYLLLLDKSIIKVNLADPTLKSREIIPGVLYKHQGHQLGLFVDNDTIDDGFQNLFTTKGWKDMTLTKMVLMYLGIAVAGVAGGLLGIGTLTYILNQNRKEQKRFCLLMEALDTFEKDYLQKFVQGELKDV